jgi:hypothetical protein
LKSSLGKVRAPYFLLIFVASGGIPTRGRGVRHVGIFVGTRLAFRFSEIGLGLRLGPHGQDDGFMGLCGGATPTQRNKIL